MLNYYKCLPEHIEKMNEKTHSNWINAENPTEEELQILANDLKVPKRFMKDALDSEEKSRIEYSISSEKRPYSIMIVEYPYETKDELGYKIFQTLPLGILITSDFIVTISKQKIPFFDDMIQNRLGDFDRSNKWQFVLKLFLGATNYFLNYLNSIIDEINKLELTLKKSMKNGELYAFMAMQKSLVFFSTALQSNKIVVDELADKRIFTNQAFKLLLKEVRIENQQATAMTETYSNVISSMSDIFSSVISNNLNIVMKFLTSVTIILSIPTIISGIYGMNVKLPMAQFSHAFAVLNVLTILSCVITIFIFWKKNYF